MIRNSDINKIILSNSGKDPRVVQDEILKRVDDSNIEELLLQTSRIKPYFSAVDMETLFRLAFEKDNLNVLKYASIARDYISDKELRGELILQHEKMPWQFYINALKFSVLFPNLFFDSKFKESPELLDTNYFNLFLSYNSASPLSSFTQDMHDLLSAKIGDSKSYDVSVGGVKEAGFACGGLEDNYKAAVAQMKGLCVVNNNFIAKLFHRRAEAKKVSLLSQASFISDNGYPVWKEIVYAPSEGQHETIIDAINSGATEVYIPNLIIKAVRPLIDLDSKTLFDQYSVNKQV